MLVNFFIFRISRNNISKLWIETRFDQEKKEGPNLKELTSGEKTCESKFCLYYSLFIFDKPNNN